MRHPHSTEPLKMVVSSNGRNPKVSLVPVKQEETGEHEGYIKGLCRFRVEPVCFV